jgi:ArsR family transcriptional regulator
MSMDPSHRDAVRVAKALGDATRFELLRRIAASGEICCRDLVSSFRVSQATVSHHLKILTDAGLVTVRREGQFGYYRVRSAALRAYTRTLAGDLAGRPRRRRSP